MQTDRDIFFVFGSIVQTLDSVRQTEEQNLKDDDPSIIHSLQEH